MGVPEDMNGRAAILRMRQMSPVKNGGFYFREDPGPFRPRLMRGNSAPSAAAYAFIKKDVSANVTLVDWFKDMGPVVLKLTVLGAEIIPFEAIP